jgi:hypothetical protein
MLRSSWVAAQLVATQVVFRYMELVVTLPLCVLAFRVVDGYKWLLTQTLLSLKERQ